MEDIIPILWLIAIGAATVIPAIAKARKEAEAKRAKTYKAARSPSEQQKSKVSAERSLYFTSETTLQENNLTSEFTEQASDLTSIESALAENPAGTDDLDDFNLRKAVIYSEILKPKFDE